MSQRRLIVSQGNNNVPFSWEQKPGDSKFCFRDFQALALHSSPLAAPAPAPSSSIYGVRGESEFGVVVSKIPPPPCRMQPRSIRNASAKEEDPFLVAYKECTKSVKNSHFVQRGSKGDAVAVVKKSKLFGFSCKSIDSCQIRDHSFLKLRSLK